MDCTNRAKKEQLSALAFANIQALASGENGGDCGQNGGNCWTEDYSKFQNCGEYTMVHPCKYTGRNGNKCYDPCIY